MKKRIEPTDAEYTRLLQDWTNAGRPFEFQGLGHKWWALSDNDKLVFVMTGSGEGIDDGYQQTSLRNRG